MAKRTLTEKQKQKLRNSNFIRTNSKDITINPNFQEEIKYNEDDGTLTFDKRSRVGKELDHILNSRNRKSSKLKDEPEDVNADVPWEFRSPNNYYYYLYGHHDEDDESVADLYED